MGYISTFPSLSAHEISLKQGMTLGESAAGEDTWSLG